MEKVLINGILYYVDVIGVQLINVVTYEATNFNKLSEVVREAILAYFY